MKEYIIQYNDSYNKTPHYVTNNCTLTTDIKEAFRTQYYWVAVACIDNWNGELQNSTDPKKRYVYIALPEIVAINKVKNKKKFKKNAYFFVNTSKSDPFTTLVSHMHGKKKLLKHHIC